MQIIDRFFNNRQYQLKGPVKSFPVLKDEIHTSDYKNAETIGRVRFGKEYLYYQDLGSKYYCPYDYIERAFERVSECHPDDSPAYYYYRLILVNNDIEFANLIFNEEGNVAEILSLLKERNPSILLGYISPKDGKRKASFR